MLQESQVQTCPQEMTPLWNGLSINDDDQDKMMIRRRDILKANGLCMYVKSESLYSITHGEYKSEWNFNCWGAVAYAFVIFMRVFISP